MIGEVRAFTGSIPSGWLLCAGQPVSVTDYPLLYASIGTTYGSVDADTFLLPNLTESVIVGASASEPDYPLGAVGGAAAVALAPSELAAHSHGILAVDAEGDKDSPVGMAWGNVQHPCYAPPAIGFMADAACAGGGLGLPHENRQPSLAVLYAIATR